MRFKSGIIPVNLTTAQRDALTAPPVGSIIYNTDLNQKQFYDGTEWLNTGTPNGGISNFPPDFLYQNTKVVQTLADFPAPVGNEIILEDKTYFIDAIKLDITGYTLKFGTRTAIQGFNQNVSSFQSFENGGTIFRGTTNMFINDIEVFLSAPNITLYDEVSDGTVVDGASWEVNQMAAYCIDDLGNFQAGCKAGRIKDIRQGFMGTQFFFGFSDGFKFQGTWTNGGMRIENTLWRAFDIFQTGGKIYYSDPLDPVQFDARFASNANIQVNGTSVGYDFPETAFVYDGQYQLQNGNASGTGTFVTNFASGFPAYDSKSNFIGNTGIQNSFPGGEFITDTDLITTISTQNVWVQANLSSTTTKDLTWTTESGGVFTYDSDNILDAFLIYNFTLTGKANDIVQIKIVKETAAMVQTDLIVRSITIQGTTAQGRAESVSISTTGRFEKGDKLIVYYRNTSGTTNVTTLTNSNGILGSK